MTLEELAKLAGVKITDCDPDKWGGALGYTTKDYPNCTVCGAKTKEDAYKSWISHAIGETAANAILELLSESQVHKEPLK